MRDEVLALAPVHFLGIGGVGMSALARILLSEGVEVSGSDQRESPTLDALCALGARIHIGHAPEHLGAARSVVFTSAVRGTNPELQRARETGLAVLHRAQMLSLLSRGRRTIAISGTHGKTTASAMIATILMRAGLDPTFVVGSDVNEQGTNGHAGRGDIFVAEADESDGSLLWLLPEVAVVTNAEAEHLDHYADLAEVIDTFRAFLAQVCGGGLAVVCTDDPGSASLLGATSPTVTTVTYGMGSGSWRIDRDGSILRDGAEVGELRLPVPGDHNLRNALAALIVAEHVGVPLADALEALAGFRGTRRRFEDRGSLDGIRVIDDYAHHPTEIAATLQAARQVAEGRRIIAIFQPHLFSRTRQLGSQLGAALAEGADAVGILPIYGAREDPIPGITSRILVAGALDAVPRRKVASLPDHGSAVAWALRNAEPGDLILTIGAGDVTAVGPLILSQIEAREQVSR